MSDLSRVLLIASANGDAGMEAGMAVLRAGGTSLDAVEAATRMVEDNLSDHSVGTGGYPNLLGDVELDASIMEGTYRRAGAVAALRDYPNPISIARAVMDKLPQHVLLMGDGAARFAAECGFAKGRLLTPEAEAAWRARSAVVAGESYSMGAATPADRAFAARDPEKTAGTVNFIARDSTGRTASAVSTSGWAFKYPGRVGDSPLIGAGNYCDDRFGACACTGLGEWAIRAGTARSVVLAMELGEDLDAACERAMRDLQSIPVPAGMEAVMNLIALDRTGRHVSYAATADRSYVWQTGDMARFETEGRRVVP